MTEAQCTESSQRSSSSARHLLSDSEHDAPDKSATMSSHGLPEFSSITAGLNDRSTQSHNEMSDAGVRHAHTQTSELPILDARGSGSPGSAWRRTDQRRGKKSQTTHRRIQFGEFTEQLRQQLYLENRTNLLKKRIKVLQKTITLSARLHRVSLWVRDGLVEISAQSDKAGFARVRQHFQDLTEVSYSHWDRELHAIDPLCKPKTPSLETVGSSGSLTKLLGHVQTDLLELLHCLRSNPRFLAQRFKLLTPGQIVSLQNIPKPPWHSNAAGTQYSKASQDRYHRSFSKTLEEYAASLERSNPLSFLLFNIYGTDQSSVDAENQLRLSTWSEVCTELMLTSTQAYESLVHQLLDRFASLNEWRARESVEFFLMGMLQRGSFLLEQSSGSHAMRHSGPHNPLTTPEAREFFDTWALDFFELLLECDGGFPIGALQFAGAVLDKLPDAQRPQFRGTFFGSWFINRFLGVALNYPENEGMLLKFHISDGARTRILHTFHRTVHQHVQNVLSSLPSRPVDPEIYACVHKLVGLVDSVKSSDPYAGRDIASPEREGHCGASLTVSLSEVVHLLDTISPQNIQESGSQVQLLETPATISTPYGQYIHSSRMFDRLKAILLRSPDTRSSTTLEHPCQEQWVQVIIDPAGRPKLPRIQLGNEDTLQSFKSWRLDNAQQGALRLFKDFMSEPALTNGVNHRNDLLKSHTLEKLFEVMAGHASAKHDSIGRIYWKNALETLYKKHPLSRLLGDDSNVLEPMFKNSNDMQVKCRDSILKLEAQLSIMEDICLTIRSSIDRSVDGFESLRLKLWYSTDVVTSGVYENAKYVARALSNMTTSSFTSQMNSYSSSQSSFLNGRPMSPRSVASSTIERPYRDTMKAMKAPVGQGGPKKLSDDQIRLTNSWLTHTPVEIFCAGEERIHRFCMEVHNAVKNLVGETFKQSPELWASSLFEQEQGLYLTHCYSSVSAPPSSRAPSISNSSISFIPSQYGERTSTKSLKSLLDRDIFTTKMANSMRLSSRAHSATTIESTSSVFSHMLSNTRSQTSASELSKSPSIFNSTFNPAFNDPDLSRFEDKAREKARFLARVQQVLVCLLLSDLGCPVWTLGSETDAMLTSNREILAVDRTLKQRMLADSLADRASRGRNHQQGPNTRPRSQSASTQATKSQLTTTSLIEQSDGPVTWDPDNDHYVDLAKLLVRLSQQVDPMEKIAVIKEFYELSLSTLRSRPLPIDAVMAGPKTADEILRRSSLDERTSYSRPRAQCGAESHKVPKQQDIQSYSDHEITQHIKSDLVALGPTTLFRDLQYISAFVPANFIGNDAGGEALTHVGLAAFAYKDEVCRSMVDVADKMSPQIGDPGAPLDTMQQVANLWMSAAQEGNPVAQRHLASLYLSQPTLLPVTLPLSEFSQIYSNDRHERTRSNTDTALCLALHWLEEASKKGDNPAKQKLDELTGANSIR